ncbi:MAG TPA: PadR family transcriptional regulator [Terracidiphilus sp.]
MGEETYGAAIRRGVEEATRQSCSIGAIYTTLERLENKRLVTTRMGKPTPQRGGRTKRMVRVTAKGIQAAGEFYAAISRASALRTGQVIGSILAKYLYRLNTCRPHCRRQ